MFKIARHNQGSSDYLRSAFFGIEDSLVSTTGLVAGIAAGSQNPQVVLLAGLVGVSVEALSMGVGQYLSQKAVDEMDGDKTSPAGTGLVMFVAYAAAGAIPVLPMALLSYPISLVVGVGSALIALYIIGYIKGKIVHRPPNRSALEVFVLGGLATMLGLLVGVVLHV